MGFVTSLGSFNVFHATASAVYNVSLGMSPGLISIVLFVQRAWDALLSPFVGHYSDNLRTRYGRRRPMLAVSILPLAVTFAALWLFPRSMGRDTLFWYMIAWSVFFCTARAVYGIPLIGLQAEATSDYHERTRLSGLTQVFFFAFAILPNWLFALAQGPLFVDPIQGFHRIGITLAVFFFLAGLLPIFYCREKLYASVSAKHANASLAQHAKAIFSNRPFAVLLATTLVCNFGYHVVNILGMYANFYYVYGGDIKGAAIMQGWTGTAFQLMAVVSAFAYPRISAVVGKRGALLLAMVVLMAGSLSKWVLYQPHHPWLQVIVSCTNSFAMTGVSVLALSMMADTVDFAELTSGERNEGLYASALQICERIGYSIGTLLSGFVLSGIGFNVRLLGNQSPETLQLMRLLYVAFPFIGALGGAIILLRYPLTETKVYAITAELDRRRETSVSA